MKTLKTIQTLAKIGKVLSCIAFIFACIGFGGSVVGALSAAFGGFAIKLGGVTIYDLFGGARYSELEGVCAALLGWMIVCAGEAVVAKFAELYFKRELAAGTPFTLSGAKELTRLGILTLAVPTGCACWMRSTASCGCSAAANTRRSASAGRCRRVSRRRMPPCRHTGRIWRAAACAACGEATANRMQNV